jgi:hypothetical protein
MTPRTATLFALGLTLGLTLPACGGHTSVTHPDGGDASPPHDTAPDLTPTDSGPDGTLPDGALADGGGDTGPATAPQFLSETSGGARLLSSNYRLELFVAPARPAGATKSPGYQLKLGPGALRNAR